MAVHQAGKVTEVTVQGTSKKVCNLQVASGDKAMSAAFWDEELATQMSHATAGEVFITSPWFLKEMAATS